MHPDTMLGRWAAVSHRRNGALGYPHETLLGMVTKGIPLGGEFRSRPPRDVTLWGLSAYNRVETALRGLGNGYRLVAACEFGLIRPGGHPLKTQTDRATALGLTRAQYIGRLKRVRQAVA